MSALRLSRRGSPSYIDNYNTDMPHREMIELIADEGYMYVNRQIKIVGVILQIAKGEEDSWELLPEDEALAIEAQWIAEDEETLRQQMEGGN